MACMGDRDKIYEYLKGRLAPRECTAFEKHLETCAACRQDLEQERQLNTWLGGLDVPEPRPGFATRLQARLADERKSRGSWLGMRWPVMSTVAAACVLSVVVLWQTGLKMSPPLPKNVPTEARWAEQIEILEKMEILQSWEMLRNWEEISAFVPQKDGME